jgi:hypothetical protein
MGTNKFDIVTLTLAYDLLIKNINIGYIFWMVYVKTLMFHLSVPYDNTIPWVPKDLTLWPWP